MRFGFFKGVALGAATSALVLVTTAAVAGSGVGGVFNLGKVNTAPRTTTLKADAPKAALKVTNTGSGPALTLGVTSGPPLTVGSSVKVKKLNADKLDGSDALAVKGSVDLSGIVDPAENRTTLGRVPGLGSFTLGGGLVAPGGDCDITFTNTSGGPVVVDDAANPGLADGAPVELVGADSRPEGAARSFTIMTADAGVVVSGHTTLTFGFPGAQNVTCAGAVQALVTR